MGNEEQLTTTRLLRDAARTFGDQSITYRTPAGEWKTTNYAETWDRVQRVGGALSGLGIGPGDRVGLLLWNSREHFESYFSVAVTGATMVQLNLRLAAQDLAYVINHSKTTMIIVDQSLLSIAAQVAPQTPGVKHWIVVADSPEAEVSSLPAEWASRTDVSLYEELIRTTEPLAEIPNISETSASGACYTTGTTGRPKGVFYSHRSTWLHSYSLIALMGMSTQDVVTFLTPMFHAQCWGQPYAATAVGARLVLPGKFNLEDMPALIDMFTRYSVTFTPAAPAILLPMLQYIRTLEEPPRFEGMRLICGATEPPVSMMKGFKELTGAEVVHAYGATESSPIVACNRLKPSLAESLSDDEAWDLRRYQGLAAIGVDFKVVDPVGIEVPRDGETVGEIRVRGPWITQSYADNPEATAASFDEEGYWISGDVGYLAPTGYLKITDRLKDVIKSGGEWISSIDLENAIVAVDGVMDAAVFGVPHPKWEERPLALVVRDPKATVSTEAIRSHLAGRFAAWQLPDEIKFVDEISRTSVGKVNKKGLRADYKDAYAS
jgi:fatty-acyl-CoA synthase